MTINTVPYYDAICGIPVRVHEIGRAGDKPFYPNTGGRTGVLHTTEGRSVNDAWATLLQHRSPPHFITGKDEENYPIIVQTRPLTAQAAALRGDGPVFANARVFVQIEMVAFSKTTPWLPDMPTMRATCAVMAWASAVFGIPLVRCLPQWRDDMGDCPLPWAVNNKRRKEWVASGKWPSAGWAGHMEVPGQGPTWHYDPGMLNWTAMFMAAQKMLAPVVLK